MAWAAGWLLAVPAFLLVPPQSSGRAWAAFAAGLSQLLRIGGVVLFFWSADLFRQTRLVTPRSLKVLFPVGIWFLVAPLAFGTRTVLTPG